MRTDTPAALPRNLAQSTYRQIERHLPGVVLSCTIALAATFLAGRFGGPVMLYALLIGAAFNFLATEPKTVSGVNFSASAILKAGVALLGIRITLGDIGTLGWQVILFVIAGVFLTIILGRIVGQALGLKSDHAVLSAGAVAICGASAALAISSVLPKHKDSERHTLLTIIGVTTISTIVMVIYPLLSQAFKLTDVQAGIFLGATIHDVAQVAGAGYIISDTAGETAIIVKLMRVACLLPAVLFISLMFRREARQASGDVSGFPLFLILFAVFVLVSSTGLLPAAMTAALSDFSGWCLVIAVAALGVKTSIKDIFRLGPVPVFALLAQTALLAVWGLGGVLILAG